MKIKTKIEARVNFLPKFIFYSKSNYVVLIKASMDKVTLDTIQSDKFLNFVKVKARSCRWQMTGYYKPIAL